MAIDDILIGVQLDTSQVPGQVDALLTVIDQLSQQVQAAIADFARFEDQANSLGTTTEALLGITRDTADAYRDLAASVDVADRAWRGFRQSALAPVIREMDEFIRTAGNAGSALRDIMGGEGSAQGEASLMRAIRGTQGASLFGVAGPSLSTLISPGNRAITPTEETLRQRARLDFAIENRRDRGIAADVHGQLDDLSDRRSGARQRFAAGEESREQREQRRLDFRGINRDQREQFAAIDRQALERSLSIRRQNRGALPMEEIQRRETIARQEFQNRQQTNEQKQEIREKAEDLKAQITIADNSEKSLQKLEAMLLKLGDIEEGLKADLSGNQLEILEDMD